MPSIVAEHCECKDHASAQVHMHAHKHCFIHESTLCVWRQSLSYQHTSNTRIHTGMHAYMHTCRCTYLHMMSYISTQDQTTASIQTSEHTRVLHTNRSTTHLRLCLHIQDTQATNILLKNTSALVCVLTPHFVTQERMHTYTRPC
jgi:hypothetical protein